MTLPYHEEEYLGDIVIVPAMALLRAQHHHWCPYKETARYIAHALLHLRGFEDHTPQLRRQMHQRERRALQALAHLLPPLCP